MYYERLEELRIKNKLSKRDVAKRLSVAESTYGKWELGQRKPDIETITSLAEYYNVSTDYLLGKTDDLTPSGEKKDPIENLKLALGGDSDGTDVASIEKLLTSFLFEKQQSQAILLQSGGGDKFSQEDIDLIDKASEPLMVEFMQKKIHKRIDKIEASSDLVKLNQLMDWLSFP